MCRGMIPQWFHCFLLSSCFNTGWRRGSSCGNIVFASIDYARHLPSKFFDKYGLNEPKYICCRNTLHKNINAYIIAKLDNREKKRGAWINCGIKCKLKLWKEYSTLAMSLFHFFVLATAPCVTHFAYSSRPCSNEIENKRCMMNDFAKLSDLWRQAKTKTMFVGQHVCSKCRETQPKAKVF